MQTPHRRHQSHHHLHSLFAHRRFRRRPSAAVASGAGLLAVALAMPLAASAQDSQVRISGFLDAGVFRGFDGVNQLGTIQRSNLAFSGVEDLGGGLKASFRLSTRFDMGDGLGEDAGRKPFWHDESTVGLEGSFGKVRLGRALSALWAQDWRFDPWSNNNRVASPAWYYWHPLTPSDRVSNNGFAEYGRMNNGIFYDSPTLGGFTLHLSGSAERTEAPGRKAGRGYSASLNYAREALSGMLAYERNGSGDRDVFVAGKYRFGKAAVMAAYDDSRMAERGDKSRSATLGATYQVDAVTFKAGYGRQRFNDDTNQFFALGADYALSRRTTLYASLGHQRYANAGSRTAVGVGMSHAF